MKKRMKDNRGFTLVELIVVMAIAGILTIGSILGANILGLGSARSTVRKINSMLDYVQVENMTKNKSYYLIVYKENDKYVLQVEAGTQVISTVELELVRGEITYRTGTLTYLVSDVAVPEREIKPKLEVCFQKDTGGVAANRDSEIITQIGVSSAGSSYTIYLVGATGKHYIE